MLGASQKPVAPDSHVWPLPFLIYAKEQLKPCQHQSYAHLLCVVLCVVNSVSSGASSTLEDACGSWASGNSRRASGDSRRASGDSRRASLHSEGSSQQASGDSACVGWSLQCNTQCRRQGKRGLRRLVFARECLEGRAGCAWRQMACAALPCHFGVPSPVQISNLPWVYFQGSDKVLPCYA
jgi:hypothetical protein